MNAGSIMDIILNLLPSPNARAAAAAVWLIVFVLWSNSRVSALHSSSRSERIGSNTIIHSILNEVQS